MRAAAARSVVLVALAAACGGRSSAPGTSTLAVVPIGIDTDAEAPAPETPPVGDAGPLGAPTPWRDPEPGGEPDVEPVPVPPAGLLALCTGPVVDVHEGAPYRGVAVVDNGGGSCCPLEGGAYVCAMDRGMQHTPILVTETFVVAGPKGPRTTVTSTLSDNQGMAHGAAPFASLVVQNRQGASFDLAVEPEDACTRRAKEAAPVCKHRGRYTLTKGVLKRVQ